MEEKCNATDLYLTFQDSKYAYGASLPPHFHEYEYPTIPVFLEPFVVAVVALIPLVLLLFFAPFVSLALALVAWLYAFHVRFLQVVGTYTKQDDLLSRIQYSHDDVVVHARIPLVTSTYIFKRAVEKGTWESEKQGTLAFNLVWNNDAVTS